MILSAVDKFTKPFKSAQASNKKLAKTLRQSRQQLKELNNQAKQIDGFKKTKQSLDAANNAYQQATAKVSQFARELSQAQVKLNSDIASTSRRLQQQEQQLKRVASQEKYMSVAKNSYQITMGMRNKMAGGSAGMLASGVDLGYVAKKVLVPSYDFEIGTSKVPALTRLDRDSADYKMLRERARELRATTAFTSNEVAQGQVFYAMTGFKLEIDNADWTLT